MISPVVHIGAIAVSFLFVVMMFHIQIAEIHEAARNRRSKRALVHNGLGEGGRNSGQGTRKSKNEWLKGLMSESERSEEQFLNTDNTMPQEKRTAERVEQEVISGRRQKSMNLVQSISKEDKQLGLKKRKKDFVHLPPIRNNTFVTVTDARGNKKTGASTGCLKEFKGRSRRSRYAAKATAEHVGRSARNLGMKSVVMKVKGSTYFRKKKAVILSWREGYTFAECKRSKGVRDPSKIMYIRDVTQLPHNGCRLPRKRRVQIVPRSSPFSLDNNSGKNLTRREGSTRASALRLLRRASALAFFF